MKKLEFVAYFQLGDRTVTVPMDWKLIQIFGNRKELVKRSREEKQAEYIAEELKPFIEELLKVAIEMP